MTNAQYAAFLNAKAASDPLGLYHTDLAAAWGGISRSGSSGSYSYGAVPGRENMPVNHVSFFDALRFANWLHNGQGDGNTETGAYTLLGGTPTPSNPMVERNAAARFFLPTDPEWYKAAYYDTESRIYYDYPAGTDTQIVCSAPTGTPTGRTAAGPPWTSRLWGATQARPARTAPSIRAATSPSGSTPGPAASSSVSYGAGS